jgi:hypothetical protein
VTLVKTCPYVCPDPRSVEVNPWFRDGEQELEDGMILPTWDPSTSLTIVRTIQLDIGLLTETARISPGSRMALVPAWWSPGTGLRGKGEEAIFTTGNLGKTQFNLSMVLPGDQLRGSAQIRTSLIFLERAAGEPKDQLSVSRSGSILWHDEISLILEGDASRFPITAIDFPDNNLGEPSACWHLEWSPRDLEASAMACFRLWINKRHTVFFQAMISQAPTPEELAIRSALRFAVATEMLQLALSYAEELEQEAFDHGSSGKVFIALIDQLFPDLGPLETRRLQQRDPGAFSTAIQAHTYLFSKQLDADR